jgi:hypothetical protein
MFAVFEAILVWAFVLWFLRPLARAFPRSCQTFGDLAKLALAHNYARIASEYGVSPEREVLLALRQLIAAEETIDVEKVAAETRFPEDLKIY